MKTIVDLNSTDFADVIRLMKKYNEKFPKEFEFPSIVTLRLRNLSDKLYGFGHLSFEITFRADMRNKIMDIHYELIGFAVMAKETVRSFNMRVRLGKDFFDRVTFLDMPKDIEIYKWLVSKTKNDFSGSNAEFIVFMCHCAGTALGAFPFALNSTVSGDRITYTTKPDFYKTAVDGIETLILENKREKQLEGWDCINLTWEQYDKLIDLIDEEEFNHIFDHLVMERVAIKLLHKPNDPNEYVLNYYDANPKTKTMNVSFGLSDHTGTQSPVYKIKFWHENNPITGESTLRWDFADPSIIEEGEYNYLTNDCSNGNERTLYGWSTISTCIKLFLYANIFMLYYKDVATDVEEKVCKNTSTTLKNRTSGRGSVRLFKQYTLKKNWKTQVNRKKAEIKCLAWGVRGHFRHYKSGKVGFVAPYVKGKERAKYQGKDYALLPQDKAM